MPTHPEPNRIVLAGGSGFIGNALAQALQDAGYEPHILTRSKKESTKFATYIWDGETLGEWAELFEGAKAVINLAGAPVTMRWTDENKKLILESRIKSTAVVGKAIRQCRQAPAVWINASAVGYYGDRADELLDETSAAGEGFLAETCVAWEKAQLDVDTPGTRKVRMRTGIVLGKEGGAFAELSKFTSLFLGGYQGSGKQWMPWIHLRDLTKMFVWSIEHEVSGAINGSGPNPCTNADFMEELRKQMHRPWSPPVPGFAMGIAGAVLGKQTDVVLVSQRAIPKVAQTEGFPFEFPDLTGAIKNLL